MQKCTHRSSDDGGESSDSVISLSDALEHVNIEYDPTSFCA